MQGHSHIKTQKRVALFVVVVVAPAADNNRRVSHKECLKLADLGEPGFLLIIPVMKMIPSSHLDDAATASSSPLHRPSSLLLLVEGSESLSQRGNTECTDVRAATATW